MRYLFQSIIGELVALASIGALTTSIGPLIALGCLLLGFGGVILMGRGFYKFCVE